MRRVLLCTEYVLLFGPAMLFAAVGLAVFPIGFIAALYGMLWVAGGTMLVELFVLLGLYACFQLLRKQLDPCVVISTPRVLFIQLMLGTIPVVLIGLAGPFYGMGLDLYVIAAPCIGALHLVFLNRGYLFRDDRAFDASESQP